MKDHIERFPLDPEGMKHLDKRSDELIRRHISYTIKTDRANREVVLKWKESKPVLVWNPI